MDPTAILALATEILKMVNNVIQGQDPSVKQANSIIWFQMTWGILKLLLPASVVTQVETITKQGQSQLLTLVPLPTKSVLP